MTDARTVQPFAEPYAMNEPVRVTVMRDLMLIVDKFNYVCTPSLWESPDSEKKLEDGDLWGPLVLCVILSLCCWGKGVESDQRALFSFVFGFYWVGLYVVILNMSMLGARNLSWLQGVGVLGYASFPIVIAALASLLLPRAVAVLRLVFVCMGAYLTTKASLPYFKTHAPPNKLGLSVYPLILFQAVIATVICLV